MSGELRSFKVVFTTRDWDQTGMHADDIEDVLIGVVEGALMAAYEHGGLKDVLRCEPMVA